MVRPPGKVDNCQVDVFAVLGCRTHCVPIDYRLLLPKKWVKDKQRCIAAGVPDEAIELNRKHDLPYRWSYQLTRAGFASTGLAATASTVKIPPFYDH